MALKWPRSGLAHAVVLSCVPASWSPKGSCSAGQVLGNFPGNSRESKSVNEYATEITEL